MDTSLHKFLMSDADVAVNDEFSGIVDEMIDMACQYANELKDVSGPIEKHIEDFVLYAQANKGKFELLSSIEDVMIHELTEWLLLGVRRDTLKEKFNAFYRKHRDAEQAMDSAVNDVLKPSINMTTINSMVNFFRTEAEAAEVA